MSDRTWSEGEGWGEVMRYAIAIVALLTAVMVGREYFKQRPWGDGDMPYCWPTPKEPEQCQ